MALADHVLAGDQRSAARLMRLADDLHPGVPKVLQALFPHTGRSRIIGITGNPGSGKSTLVDRLISHYRNEGRYVGVIAVDPSSPFTGGAILGDRVRMNRHFNDEKVFIRSMATRGHLGGLSKSAGEVLLIMEAMGCDPILVETVGVGQAEVEIAGFAQTSVVVTVPGLGDEIQAIKAGIMEIADVFTVNKADREGAERLMADIHQMLHMLDAPNGDAETWEPRIVKTVAFRNEGIENLAQAIEEHARWLERTGQDEQRRLKRERLQFFGLLRDRLDDRIGEILEQPEYEDWDRKLLHREIDPYRLAREVLDKLR